MGLAHARPITYIQRKCRVEVTSWGSLTLAQLSRTKNVYSLRHGHFPHIRQYSVPTLPSSRCTVTATCIVFSQSPGLQLYSYRYRRYDADWLSFFGRSRSMSFEPPKQQPPKQRVRRESEDFNVGGNKREPAVPLRRRNIGTKG